MWRMARSDSFAPETGEGEVKVAGVRRKEVVETA